MEGLGAAISRDSAQALARLRTRGEPALLAWAALLVLLAAAAAYLLHESRGTTFWFDEWNFVLWRRGNDVGTFLRPYNSHLSLIPIAIYRVLFATAGLRNYAPYRALVTAGHLVCVLLVFVYASRRVNPFLALITASLLLFLGPAWQNILWPFQIAWLISLACGVGTLLMLDRRDRTGDFTACALLLASLASSSIGVPVLVGAAVDLLWSRRRRDAWIVGIPLVLYVAWALAYQHAPITRAALEGTPRFAAEAFAGAMSALFGLAGHSIASSSAELTWGVPLAVAALGLLVWRLVRLGAVPGRAGALLSMTIVFWLLAGGGRAGTLGVSGYDSRYLYVSGLMMLLAAVELARGVRVSQPVLGLLAALAAGAVISNLTSFQTAGTFLRGSANGARGDLAALDLVRNRIGPAYLPRAFPGGQLLRASAGALFAAERALGDPAPSPTRLLSQPEGVRQTADTELISALGVALVAGSHHAGRAGGGQARAPRIERALGGGTVTHGACVAYTAGLAMNTPFDVVQLTLPRGGVTLRARSAPAVAAVRRFGAVFMPVGTMSPGRTAMLHIPSDRLSVPWRLQVQTTGQVEICGRSSA